LYIILKEDALEIQRAMQRRIEVRHEETKRFDIKHKVQNGQIFRRISNILWYRKFYGNFKHLQGHIKIIGLQSIKRL